MRWFDSIINWIDLNLSKLQEIVKDRGAWCAAAYGITKSQTWLRDWTTTMIFTFYWLHSLVAQMVKNLPAKQETWVWSLSQEDPLEKGMAIHCSILAWRIPWIEEPGGLQSMGSHRVGHGWMTNTYQRYRFPLGQGWANSSIKRQGFLKPSLAFEHPSRLTCIISMGFGRRQDNVMQTWGPCSLHFWVPQRKIKGQRFWTILWVKILYITGILIKAKLFFTIEFEHLLTYFLTLLLHFQVYGNCFPIFLIFLLRDLSSVRIKK